MHQFKSIACLFLMFLSFNKIKAQNNPLVIPLSTNLTIPVDETKRAQNSIILQAGFKYGAGTAGSRLTLQISKYPNYVTNGYQENLAACDYPASNLPLVGEVEGNFSVSLSGSSIYEIPVKMSPGTAGMEPNLRMVYSSGSSSGPLGLGWNLSGLSAISRINKSPYLDTKFDVVKLNANDVFALDGNRLILKTGTYGAASSTYGTELESFNNVTAQNALGYDPQYFIVVDKNGTTAEYGNSVDSRLIGVGDVTPLIWFVNKVTDIYGNYLLYHYKELNGERVIERIEYTGNTAAGLAPYNEIQFEYMTKTEKNTVYVGDKEFKSTQLLKSITALANGIIAKKYVLNYQFSFNSILSDVTEINQDGTQVKATGFCYNDPFNNSIGQNSTHNVDIYSTTADYNNIKSVVSADLDGDGFSDVIIVKPQSTTITDNVFTARKNNYPNNVVSGGNIGFVSMPTTNATGIISDTILGSFVYDTNLDDKQEAYIIVYNKTADKSENKKYHIQKIQDIGYPASPNVQITNIKSITLSNDVNLIQTPSKFYYDVNDYSGDGVNDELIIDQEKVTINSSILLIPLADQTKTLARPFDFDGDGYLEVVIFKNLITSLSIEIIKYNGTNLTSIYSTSISYPLNTTQDLLKLITIGDYNGDGKGDILYLNETKQNLNIKYSTGSVFSTAKSVTSFEALNSALNYNIISPDINGDGINDIIFSEITTNPLQNYISYYSIGDQFIEGFSTSGKFKDVFQSMKYYYTYKGINGDFIKTDKKTVFESSVDFNGDGVFDVLSIDGTFTNAILNNLLSTKTLFLSRITTGLNKQIDITYANAHTKFDNQKVSVYEKNYNSYSGALLSFTPNNYLVSLVKYRNTNLINLSQTVRYFYQGAIYHKFGKGFLGFEESGHVNLNTGLGSVSSFESDPVFHVANKTIVVNGKLKPGVLSGITYYSFSGATGLFDGISSKTTTTFLPTLTSAPSFFVAPSTIDSKDFLSSTASVTNLTYNLSQNGNLINQLVTYGWPTQGTIKTENTHIVYQNIGTVPFSLTGIFKPQSETYTSTQTGEASYERKTEYIYSGKNLATIIKDPIPSSLALTTSFSNYNVFGSAQKTDVTATDVEPRTAETIFDLTGRFISKTINIKGDVEEFIYDPKYGSLLQSKDISGLISKFSYDGLGRLIKSQLPDNTVNTISYDYVPQPSVESVFSKTVRNEGEAYFTTFYNHLGDITGTQTEDVNSNTIVTNHKYDFNTGFLIQSTEPHFSTVGLQPNYLATKFTYDPVFRRLIREETHIINASSPNTSTYLNRYTQYDYNSVSKDYLNGLYLYNQGFISKTNQTNKKIIKANNAAGQLLNIKNFNPEGINGSDYQKTVYNYNSNGQPNTITLNSTNDPNPIVHTFGYNAIAQQTVLIDPSAGTINYNYSKLDELLHRDDANGSADYEYDNLGRLIKKDAPASGVTTYQYVTGNNGKNQLEKITGPNVTTELTYDVLGRTISYKETVAGATPKVFTTLTDYDKYSNIIKYTYPGGFITKYNYTANGNLTTIADDSNNTIWQLNNQNAIGQITDYTYGNGINTLANYTNLHYLSGIEHGSIHKQVYNFDPLNGNLLQRDFYNYSTGTHNREKFSFDALDRLIQSNQVDPNAFDASIYTNNIEIDEKGNIMHKDDAGDYLYGNTSKPFNLTQINNPTPNIPLNTLGVTYNDLRKVSQLTDAATNKKMNFIYGNDDERVKVTYEINTINEYTRYYQSDYEREESSANTKEWTYIYAPTGLAAVLYKPTTAGAGQLLYAITDHLGSPVLLTNQAQQIQEEYSFDSWGRRRNPVDWSYTGLTQPTILNRGFTFHEHIDEFNLINMNGRVYDPVLGRFLQPDNQVQYPDFLQTYNRYAYVFNNPLSYTDPSGWGGDSGNENSDDLLWGGGNGLSPAYSNYSDFNAAQNPSGTAWMGGGGGGSSGWYAAPGSSLDRYNYWMASSTASIFSGSVTFNLPFLRSRGRYTDHISWGHRPITFNFSSSSSSSSGGFGMYSFGSGSSGIGATSSVLNGGLPSSTSEMRNGGDPKKKASGSGGSPSYGLNGKTPDEWMRERGIVQGGRLDQDYTIEKIFIPLGILKQIFSIPAPTNEGNPYGIPSNYIVKQSQKGGGKMYSDPLNPNNNVREMPGNPNSPHPSQQIPYIKIQKNGRFMDANGNYLPNGNLPEAHIPANQFWFH